jgi:hypothetical protein
MLPAGSASAPALCFSGDVDTGIYNVADNDLGFVVGGFRQFEVTFSLVSSAPNFQCPNLIVTDAHATNEFYQEGTWTITMGDGTNNFTLSTNTGYYTRIGNMYYCTIHTIWTSKGSASGSIRINLPATINASKSPRIVGTVGYMKGILFLTQLAVIGSGGSSYLTVWDLALLGGSPSQLTNTSFSGTGEFQTSVFFSL